MNLIEILLGLLGLSTSPENLTKKAVALAAKEDVVAAVEAYKRALTADPLHIPAYDGLGKVYFRMGFREEADREFAIADGLEKLSKNPDDIEVAVKMGRAMMDKGLHKLAPPYLEPLAKKHPRHPDLLKILGLCHKSLGQDKKAREYFRSGLERWPRDADFYLHLGSMELKAGNNKEGERLTNMARLLAKISSDPNDHPSRYELAQMFLQREQFAEAAVYIREAVGINSGDIDYWLALGDCYHRAGQHPAAVDAIKQAIKLHPSDARPQRMLAKVYQFMGRFQDAKAVRELATILEGGGNDAANPTQGARFLKYLLSIGQTEETDKQLDQMLNRWPNSNELKLIKGRLLIKRQQHLEAIQLLKAVAHEKEAWAEPRILMAMAYQKLGDKMAALAEGQLATRLAPKSHAAHKIYGDILREQGKFGMAENAYETAENLKQVRKEK